MVLDNSGSIHGKLKTLTDQFSKLYRHRAYLHSYVAEGMDEMEFIEAECNLNDLISEY